MASSKKKTLGRLGIPPSKRRPDSSPPVIDGLGLTVPAAHILDVPRIKGVWEDWHRSGVLDRAWDLGAYLEILTYFLREGLIDWSGLEETKPVVRAVLDMVKAGEMTPAEIQASIEQSSRDHTS